MDRGALYIVSGDKYINAAKKSARSLKKHNPSLPVTIYTDRAVNSDVFDDVVQLDESVSEMGDSILSEENFPYEQNLYLDADTYVCDKLDEIFDLLNRFDLAASYGFGIEQVESNIPISFPELNTGVLVYKDNPQVRELFKNWQERYKQDTELGISANQPSFRKSIYHSDIDFSVLPKIYNCRTPFSGVLNERAKIIHGWHDQPIEKIALEVNKTHNPRLHVGIRDNVEIFSPSKASIKDWVLFIMATNGIFEGFIRSLQYATSLIRSD